MAIGGNLASNAGGVQVLRYGMHASCAWASESKAQPTLNRLLSLQ